MKSASTFIFDRSAEIRSKDSVVVIWDVTHRERGVYLGRVVPSTRHRRWHAHPADAPRLPGEHRGREAAAEALYAAAFPDRDDAVTFPARGP